MTDATFSLEGKKNQNNPLSLTLFPVSVNILNPRWGKNTLCTIVGGRMAQTEVGITAPPPDSSAAVSKFLNLCKPQLPHP